MKNLSGNLSTYTVPNCTPDYSTRLSATATAMPTARAGQARRPHQRPATSAKAAHAPTAVERYTALGVFGHVARAGVFALIGYGADQGGIDHNPQQAIGLDCSLRELAGASYGPALLGLVAVGLSGFGFYSMADARYRKV